MLCLLSEIARFLGSAMGIAIANRKNRGDFGALSFPDIRVSPGKQKRDRDRDSPPRPRPRLNSQPQRGSGFLKRALAQTCLRAWYQVRFLRNIFGHSWGLVYGEGGAPGTVPLHNLRVTSHVLHQEVPLGWYRARLFLGGRFGPEKKIFSPPPPKIPNSPQTPSRPLPILEPAPPPRGIFNKETTAPPPGASDSPFPLPEPKKIKNIRNVHQAFEIFLGIVRGPGEGRGGAPGTVPLQNPEVTSRKTCLRNAERGPLSFPKDPAVLKILRSYI